MRREKNTIPYGGKSLTEIPREYVCIDVETTGLNPQVDNIIDISGIHVRNRTIIQEFSSLVALPGKQKIPAQIVRLTGITDKMLATAPDINEIIPKFYEFVGNAIVVGHNVTFDLSFIGIAAKHCDLRFENDYVDTLQLAKKMLPSLSHYKLSDLAKHFKIDVINAHRASSDTLTTAKVLERFYDMNWKCDHPDAEWTRQMLIAEKKARATGKKTWELRDRNDNETLAEYLETSVGELLGESETPPVFVDNDVNQLLLLFDQLNDEGREKLLGYANDLVTSKKYII